MGNQKLKLFLLASSTLFALPAWAQTETPPPEHYTLDARGVDLVTGKFAYQSVEVTVGDPSDGGLSHGRIWAEDGWHYLVDGRIIATGNVYTVVLGGRSDVFVQSGTTYAPRSNQGQSLSRTGNLFTYTSSDGTIAQYSTTYNGSTSVTLGNAALMNIKQPNGEQINLHWNGVSYCAFRDLDIDDGIERPEPPCQSWANAVRVDGISNNRGYQINFIYASNDVPQDGLEANMLWGNRIGARGVNLAISGCATNDSTCGGSYAWPSVSYDVGPLGGDFISATDHAGRTTHYGSDGRLTSVRLPGSPHNNLTIAYSGSKVASVVDASGTWHYSFSDAGNIRTATVAGPLNQSLTVVSDLTIGRATSVTEVISVSPPVSRTTSYQYDAQRRLTRATNPDGSYTDLTYDARGNVTQSVSAPRPGSSEPNIVTTAAYPATCTNLLTCNKPESTTDALGRTTNYTYDPGHGGVLTVTASAPSPGAARPQTRITYAAQSARYKNASDVLISGTSIILPVTSSTCVVGSSCEGTPNELKSHVVYGSASGAHNLQPSAVSTGAGDGSLVASTSLTYTPVGDVQTVDGPLPGVADTTTYRYDNVRRVVGVVGPDPDAGGPLLHRAQRVSYDPRGNALLTEVGAVHGTSDVHWSGFISLQQQSVYYDHHNRPLVVGLRDGSANVHAVTQISYDAAGRVECTALRMNPSAFAAVPGSACQMGAEGSFGPDRISKNEYDVAGQLIRTTSGFSSSNPIVEQASYNLNGQPISLTDGNGNVSVVEYDGFGRMAKMRYPNASGGGTSITDYEQYTYNAGGLVTQHRLRSGQSVSYSYDGLNRVTLADATAANDIGYTYDNLGRTLTAFGGGQTLTMTYDALGRQLTQTSPLGTVTSDYDLAGRRTRLWWPDGYHVNYDYNTVGDLVSMREYGVTNWYLAAWNHDNLGRRTQMTRSNGANTAWSYDNAGRLAQLNHDLPGTADDQTFNFSYNPAGQIVNRTVSNTAYVYAPAVGSVSYANNGRNQVTSVGGTAVTYDAAQNITGAPTGTYSYDGLNRLQSSNAGGGSSSYSYDPASRLYQMDATRFLYDGARPMAEYDASGNVLRRHIPGLAMDETLLTYEGAGILDRRYLIADERLSVTAITDPLGNILARNTYDEYGQPGSANAGRFQYTGQIWLPNAQAYHYKARVYAPQLGRFMQADPIGYGDGPNLYAYVGADPMNKMDPWGLKEDPATPLPPIIVTAPRCEGVSVNGVCYEGVDFRAPFPQEQYWRVDDGVATPVQGTVTEVVKCPGGIETSRTRLNRQVFSGADSAAHTHPNWVSPDGRSGFGPGPQDYSIPANLGIPLLGITSKGVWSVNPTEGGLSISLIQGRYGDSMSLIRRREREYNSAYDRIHSGQPAASSPNAPSSQGGPC